jgi:rod shape determining protein RodA
MAIASPPRPSAGSLGSIHSSPGDPSRNIDWVLMAGIFGLMAIGLPTVYSTSRPFLIGLGSDPFGYTQRQLLFFIVGVGAMLVVMALDYQWFRERSKYLYGAGLGALVLVLGLAKTTGGAKLSFDLGPVSIQPAEFAKAATLLFLAGYLADEREDNISYPRFLGGLLIVGIPTALILVQPDLGSASVFIAMAMGVLLVAGAEFRHIILVTALSVATGAAAVISGLVAKYQVERLTGFVNQNSPNKDLKDLVQQVKQAKRAYGNGGLFGKGWLKGPLTNQRQIPVQWADFPATAIAEQFGMIGIAVLLAMFAVVLVRIWRTAHLSRDMLGTYICAGVFTMLLWHLFENVGMSLGIMPVTGIPLPMISYGGSSTVAFLMMLGLVQSVHMRRFR